MTALETTNLTLIPATAELVGLEVQDRAALGRRLGAVIPGEWPPELLADAVAWFRQKLDDDPGLAGWLCWYGVTRGTDGQPPTLAASGGFIGPPREGVVETGYSVLPAFRRRGYATEIVGALAAWALAQPGVEKVVADVHRDNAASHRVLAKNGFVLTGPSAEPEYEHYERTKA